MRRVILAGTALLLSTAAQAQYMPNTVIQERAPGLRRFELIVKNRTGYEIDSVTAKSATMRNFSTELLPNPIRPGRQGLLNLIDGKGTCVWDFYATLSNGGHSTITMNVCSSDSWTIN